MERREFLKKSSVLTAGAVAAATLPSPLMVHAAGSETISSAA